MVYKAFNNTHQKPSSVSLNVKFVVKLLHKRTISRGIREHILARNHLNVKFVVKHLQKNIIWLAIQEFTPVRNHLNAKIVVRLLHTRTVLICMQELILMRDHSKLKFLVKKLAGKSNLNDHIGKKPFEVQDYLKTIF